MEASTSRATTFSELDEDADIQTIKSLLKDVRKGLNGVKESVHGWRERQTSTSDLTYSSGISLLSLKNHLLLSYLSHLLSLFSLKLTSQPLSNSPTITSLVKLRLTLEKIGPLEGKLKYQIEKLVRKADVADDGQGGGEDDLLNDPLAFRPNPANMVMDRDVGSSDSEADYSSAEQQHHQVQDANRSGLYKPPRIAAMPYTEGPSKRKGGKKDRPLPSHTITDISTSLNSTLPSSLTTTGLSVSIDPTQRSSTARHLERVREYEEGTYNRMRMSKKESKKRRSEEEEVAFGGLGSGNGGRRRLGGYGAEFDGLLRGMEKGGDLRAEGAFEKMRGMKRVKVGGGAGGGGGDMRGGLGDTDGGMGEGGGGVRKGKRNAFDRAVGRSEKTKTKGGRK